MHVLLPGSESAESPSARGDVVLGAQRRPVAAEHLLGRLLVSGGAGSGGMWLLCGVLAGTVLLAADPALAEGLHAHGTPVADLAENEDFWNNVLRYISFFFSVLLGTAYQAVKPLIEAFKKPTTAILSIVGLAALAFFVSFTVQAMLGVTEPLDYVPSSIVTPQQ